MECDEIADTRHIRVLPDSCVELFINYTQTPVAIIGEELHSRSIITSRMSRPTDVQMRKGSGCLAICFQAGMAYKFFHLPMHILADNVVALEAIWKEKAAEIEGRLAEAPHNQARVNIVQQLLTEQIAGSNDDPQLIYCLEQAKLNQESLTVSQLAKKIGLSQRQLSRRFQQHVGLSPKEYLRVSRFTHSLQHLKRYPACSLTEIAYESRYFDQAHFIRDYKEYTGYTPGEVVKASDIVY